MASLTLNSLTKVFEDGKEQVVAVDDISISIEDGEFLVVVGPSGCGKSTTLRMVAGLESITSGNITLRDRVINDVKPQNRDIAMVFQSYALYPHMSVEENIAFGLEESTTFDNEKIQARVEETANLLDIPELLDRTPRDLSGGQRQRVALGRAIVRDPEVFLMDEPLSNLDAKLRAQMRTELQRLQEELEVTTMYVTHDQTEAMTMGDRIAILNAGELQQVATPLECYHEPANQFVAGFLGEPSMNFFEMTFEQDRLVGDLFEYSLPTEIAANMSPGREVVLGIRPEAVELVSEKAGPTDFDTQVDVVEPMGNENIVYLSFPDVSTATAPLVATVSGMHRLTQDQSVVARLPADAIHIFDQTTGRALHTRTLSDEVQLGAPPV